MEGAGDFDDSTQILTYDPEILKAMSPTHQAAFDFHGGWYYRVQRLGLSRANDSMFSRKMTGAIFSDAGPHLIPPTQGIERARFVCDAPGKYQFYILPNDDGLTVRVHFTIIDSRYVKDLTYGDYDVRNEHDPVLNMLGHKISQGLLYSERQLHKSHSWVGEWASGRSDENNQWYSRDFQPDL